MEEQGTRARILGAALADFAAHGYAGARIVRIAEAAGVNRERLYHYVGDKAALFDACLEDALQRIVDAEPFAVDDLGAYVAAMLDFHRREPDVLGLLQAEAKSGRAPSAAARQARRGHYARRVAEVRDAQRGGAIAPDVDARIIVYSVLALVVTARVLPQLTDAILSADAKSAALEPDDLREGFVRLFGRLSRAG